MALVAQKMDYTDTSTWWRLPAETELAGPGLRITDVGLDGRDHHAPYHPHWQRQRYGWIYLLAGRGFVESSACGRLELEPGDVATYRPEHWHNYGPLPGEAWIEVFCFVDGPLSDALLAAGELPDAPVVKAGLDAPIRDGFLDLVARSRRGDAAGATAAWYVLVGRLASRPTVIAGSGRERHASELLAIADRICADPGHPWSFPQLAEQAGMGHEAFRKAFTRRYRMPPQAFLERERMHLACQRLWWGARVKEAAAAAGYADPYHFSRQFKKRMGRSPRDFVRAARDD